LAEGEVTITDGDIIKSRPLNPINRDHDYPQKNIPFYLYGTPQQMHISHMLLRSPNVALSAANVTLAAKDENSLKLEKYISAGDLSTGLILALTDHREAAMQPFPERVSATEIDKPHDTFFFRNGRTFDVSVWKDPKKHIDKGPGLLEDIKQPVWSGVLTLGPDLDYDSVWPNKDPAADNKVDSTHWQKKLSEIPSVLNANYKG
jgi:hypothetical protein